MSSLKNQAVSGVKWLAINQIVQRVIRIVTFAILARILDPEVFGLFAMAFIAIDGFSFMKSFGVDGALIQRKVDDTFEDAKHTAFFMFQATALVIFLIFQLSAPLIAGILKNPDVLTIMRALGVIFIINNLGRLPNVLLTKKMRFNLLAIIELAATLVNSVFAVLFAMLWRNVWSLVAAYLIKMIFTSIATWCFEPYRVKMVFKWPIAKELFHFGKFMMGMGVLGFITYNMDQILISRFLGAEMLGFFVLAQNITAFTQQNLLSHIGRVLFPAFSVIQDDPDAIKRGFLKTARYISVIDIPFTLGIMAVAPEFTRAFYGEKYGLVAPLIQIIAFGQVIAPLMSGAFAVFMACGKIRWNYMLQFWGFWVRLCLLFLLSHFWGIYGVAAIPFFMACIFQPIQYFMVRRLVNFTFKEFLSRLNPALPASLIMVGVVYGVKWMLRSYPGLVFFNFHHVLPLLYFMVLAGPVYVICVWLIDRSLLQEILELLLPRFFAKEPKGVKGQPPSSPLVELKP